VRVAAQRLHLICTVEGRIASRAASVRKRAARLSIARRAGHACSSSSTRWWDRYLRGVTADASCADGSWCTSDGICVRLRCAAFATRRATVESLRRFTCRCNGTRAETIAASRPAVVRCAATVEAQVRGPPVPLSDRFVQSTQIAARPLPTQPSSEVAKLLCTDHRRQVQSVVAPSEAKHGLEAQRQLRRKLVGCPRVLRDGIAASEIRNGQTRPPFEPDSRADGRLLVARLRATTGSLLGSEVLMVRRRGWVREHRLPRPCRGRGLPVERRTVAH